MPADRIFKLSIPGLMFFISFIFFYDFLGGDVNKLLDHLDSNNLLAILLLIFSTPIIGVIFSTIIQFILRIRYGYLILYYPPLSTKIINHVLAKKTDLRDRIIINGTTKWTKRNMKEFYPYYQVLVRERIGGESSSFLERRWSVYWTHLNNIWVILITFIITATIRFFEYRSCWTYHIVKPYHVIGILIILLYCIAGYFALKSAKIDATKFEHLLLEKAIDEDENKKIEEKRNNSSSWLSILLQLLRIK